MCNTFHTFMILYIVVICTMYFKSLEYSMKLGETKANIFYLYHDLYQVVFCTDQRRVANYVGLYGTWP